MDLNFSKVSAHVLLFCKINKCSMILLLANCPARGDNRIYQYTAKRIYSSSIGGEKNLLVYCAHAYAYSFNFYIFLLLKHFTDV